MQKDISFLENRVSAKGSLWKERVSNSNDVLLLKSDNDIPDLIAKILAGRNVILAVLMIFCILRLINYLKILVVYLILIME